MRHEISTKGHWYGHVFRRVVHLSMVLIPFLYYDCGTTIANFFGLTPRSFIVWTLLFALLIESLRLVTGFVFFGQRKHEARRISSFIWGALGIVAVLLFAPNRGFGTAIIWSLALGDPCLGEARRLLSKGVAAVLGTLVVLAVWWGCAYWFGLSYWWGVFLAPLSVAAEWKSFSWIDDNVLMLLVPLAVVLMVW